MDVIVERDQVTWKVIGGILDFYIFAGPAPAAVTEQLTRVVGRPHLPPYWSLGFHNCKWVSSADNESAQSMTCMPVISNPCKFTLHFHLPVMSMKQMMLDAASYDSVMENSEQQTPIA